MNSYVWRIPIARAASRPHQGKMFDAIAAEYVRTLQSLPNRVRQHSSTRPSKMQDRCAALPLPASQSASQLHARCLKTPILGAQSKLRKRQFLYFLQCPCTATRHLSRQGRAILAGSVIIRPQESAGLT
jgi:hypothetical protein